MREVCDFRSEGSAVEPNMLMHLRKEVREVFIFTKRGLQWS